MAFNVWGSYEVRAGLACGIGIGVEECLVLEGGLAGIVGLCLYSDVCSEPLFMLVPGVSL